MNIDKSDFNRKRFIIKSTIYLEMFFVVCVNGREKYVKKDVDIEYDEEEVIKNEPQVLVKHRHPVTCHMSTTSCRTRAHHNNSTSKSSNNC